MVTNQSSSFAISGYMITDRVAYTITITPCSLTATFYFYPSPVFRFYNQIRVSWAWLLFVIMRNREMEMSRALFFCLFVTITFQYMLVTLASWCIVFVTDSRVSPQWVQENSLLLSCFVLVIFNCVVFFGKMTFVYAHNLSCLQVWYTFHMTSINFDLSSVI